MKKYLVILWCMLCWCAGYGQGAVHIVGGTKVQQAGPVYTSLIAGTFVNHGTYTDTGGTLLDMGGMSYSGSGTMLLHNFTMNHAGTTTTLGGLVSVKNTASLTAGNLAAGSGNLYIRTDMAPLANLGVTGVLTGTAQGLITKATVTSGPCPLATTLTTNVGGPVVLYQWQSSPNNITFTNITGATNASYAALVTATAYYRAQLTTTNSAFSQATASVLVTTTGLPVVIPPAALTICFGATTPLSAAGADTYTWSPSTGLSATTGSVVAANPTVTTTYTITGTTACGSSAVTTTISVLSVPAPSPIMGGTAVCVGRTTSLSSAVGGGFWFSLDNSIASVNASGVVSGVSAGTVPVVYTVTNACGTGYGFAAITVNTFTPTTGTAILCVSDSTTLSNATTGGAWSSSAMGVATVSSVGVVSGVAAGTADISYSLADGCVDVFTVTVQPPPTAIIGTTSVCEGSSTTLSDSVAGGSWVSENTGVATIGSTGIVSGLSVGTTTISYTLASGCGMVTTTVTVHATPGAIAGTASLCAGNTTTLSNSATGGTWSSSATSIATIDAAGIVSGLAAGTASITYTAPAGCGTTSTVVLVNAAPSAIVGSTSVCEGTSITLSNSVAGGSWVSDNTGVATIGSTGIVSGVSVGTTTISYTLASGCGMVTTTVTVHATPGAIAGTASLCAGNTTTLSNSATGGTWSSSATSIATIDAAGIVSGLAAGTASITYTSPAGCGTTSTVVLVNAAPSAIAGSTSVCEGTSITLSNSVAGGSWVSDNTGVATIGSTGIVSGVSVGTTTISYTLASGCGMVTSTVTVNSSPSLATISGSTNVCEGSTISLSTTGTGGTWSSSNASATVSLGGVVSGVSAGTSIISYTVSNTCGSSSGTYTVSISALPTIVVEGNTIIYAGSSTSLTANGGVSYTWSSGTGLSATTGATVSANPSTTTVYTVTGTNICGSNTVLVTVSVVPVPTLAGSTACPGSVLTLTSTAQPINIVWQQAGVGINTVTSTYASSATTVAGTGTEGSAANQFSFPRGVYVDAGGNSYVADRFNHRIQKWAPGVTSGTTVAGGTFGSGANQLNFPQGVYVDAGGNIYVADVDNHRIQKWAPGATSGTTVAGTGTAGTGANQLNYPIGVFVDAGGNIYVADQSNHRIQKWAPGATSGTTVAGTGTAGSSANQLNFPQGVSVDASGNIYVADLNNHRIQKWAPGATSGTMVAGTGIPGSGANRLNGPLGVYVDAGGNIYVADVNNNRIQKWAPGATSGTTVAGTGTPGSSANQLNFPRGVSVDASGNIYVADGNNHRIQQFAASIVTTYTAATAGSYAAVVTTHVGAVTTNTVTVNALPDAGSISGATSVCAGSNTTFSTSGTGGTWSSSNANATVSSGGVVSGVSAGTSRISYTVSNTCGSSSGTYTVSILSALPPTIGVGGNTIIYAGSSTSLTANGGVSYTWSPGTGLSATTGATISANPSTATIYTVTGTNSTGCSNAALVTVSVVPVPTLAGSTACPGSVLTLTSTPQPIHIVWQQAGVGVSTVTPTYAASATTVAGTGTFGSGADQLYNPKGVYVDAGGNIYVADQANQRIQKWAPGATSGTTVAGTGTSGSGANQLWNPNAVYVDAGGNIYVSDQSNHRIQKWAPGATSGTTVAGTGTSGSAANQLSNPIGVFVDAGGNIYVADLNNHRIQKWAPGATSGTMVAGTGIPGSGANQLNNPFGVFADAGGNIYVADYSNHRIQKWAAGATSGTMVAGTGSLGSAANQLKNPAGVYVDAGGNIYVPDRGNHRIQKWAPGATSGTTVAGTGTSGFGANQLNNPQGVYVDAAGTIYVADWANHRIQQFAASIENTYTAATAGSYAALVTTQVGAVTTNIVTVNGLPNAGSISGATSVNSGASITLSNTTTGGTWSSSDPDIATVGSTGVVTGVSAGTVTISYTVTNSCGSASATKTVTVNAALETPITGTLSVCVGSTTTLSNATSGGSWSSSNTARATINTSGEVTGVSTGIVIISYTLLGTSITAIVTVNTAPVAGSITGSSSACAGSSITLANPTSGGTWSSIDTDVATIGTSGVVSGLNVGTTTISYTVINDCGTDVATRIVTVTPLPDAGTISGASTICSTTTATLSSSVSGGTWSSNYTAGATVNASTGLVTGVAAGSFIISYRMTNSCGTVYATFPITVLNAPAPGAISGTATVCASATTTLANTTAGGTWSSTNNGAATIDATTGVVTGVAAGTTTISYNVTNICGSATASRVVTVNALPVAAVITGTASISAGTTTTLTATPAAGTWLSGSGAIASVNASGVVTGTSVGIATISYNRSNTCGTTTTTVAVAVTAATTPIAGTRVVCEGATTNLTNATTGGTWSTTDGVTATVNTTTGVVTGVAAGTTTITYTFSGGGNVTATVTVNAAPAAYTGSGIVCIGSQLNLGSIIPGCTWTSGTTTRATVVSATGVVTGVAVGTVNISYVNTSGCRTVTQLTVNPALALTTGATSPCTGSTITLSNTTSGGTWSSSNTARATIDPSSGVLTPISGGTVTISYAISAGCVRTTTVTVGTPTPITGNPNVCLTQTSLLSSTGGVWNGSSDPAVASLAASGFVTGVSEGTAVVTYRSTSNPTCFVTQIVTVNPLPSVIVPVALCPTETATLVSSPSGGRWTSANVTTVSVDSLSGLVTGVFYSSSISVVNITYTLPTTCSRSTMVTVNQAPAPIGGGTANICISGSTTLTNSTSGGTWSSATPSVATVTSGGLVNGASAGLATISFTNSVGCARTIVVTVNAIPGANSGTASLCRTATTTLSNAAGAGTWTSSNSSTASVGMSTGIVTGTNVGTANITYTRAAGCTSVTVVTVNSCARPGMTEGTDGDNSVFMVSPNPTTGAINLTTDVAGKVVIYTIDGKQLQQYEAKAGTTGISLPAGLTNGVYMLRFTGADGSSKMVRLVYQQ